MKLSPKFKTGIIILLVIVFFIILNLFSVAKSVKNFFYWISLPAQRTFWSLGNSLSDFFAALLVRKNLREENEAFQLRIQELLSEKAAKRELEKENEILREALKLGLQKEFELKMAEIIGKDISQDFLLIDKGAKDGLVEDLIVITEQKVLVGKVKELYNNFSKVALVSHPETSLDVEVFEKEIEGMVRGKGNFHLSLELLPKEKEIEKGDLIITTSLSRTYPKGLLVGYITEVQHQDVEPFQEAKVQSAFNIGKIKYLFIITDY